MQEEDRRLRGLVTDPAGNPVAHAMVLAWPDDRMPSGTDLRSVLTGEGDGPGDVELAESNEDGRFVMEPPSEGSRHTLTAITSVGFCLEHARGVSPGAKVTLVASPVYAAGVQCRDVLGAIPRSDPNLWGAPTGWGSDCSDLRTMDEWQRHPELGAFVPTDGLPSGRTRYDALYLFSSDRIADRLGPVYFTIAVPGYEEIRVAREAVSIGTFGDAFQVVRLERTAEHWFDLEVTLEGSWLNLCPQPSSYRDRTVVVVDLHDTMAGRVLRYPVKEPLTGRFVIEGIPSSVYACVLRFKDSSARMPSRELAQEVDLRFGNQRIALGGDGLGGIHVLAFGDAHEYSGRLRLSLRSASGQECQRTFSGPPYTFHGVVPGEYAIRVLEWSGITPDPERISWLGEVLPDVTTSAVLVEGE